MLYKIEKDKKSRFFSFSIIHIFIHGPKHKAAICKKYRS